MVSYLWPQEAFMVNCLFVLVEAVIAILKTMLELGLDLKDEVLGKEVDSK